MRIKISLKSVIVILVIIIIILGVFIFIGVKSQKGKVKEENKNEKNSNLIASEKDFYEDEYEDENKVSYYELDSEFLGSYYDFNDNVDMKKYINDTELLSLGIRYEADNDFMNTQMKIHNSWIPNKSFRLEEIEEIKQKYLEEIFTTNGSVTKEDFYNDINNYDTLERYKAKYEILVNNEVRLGVNEKYIYTIIDSWPEDIYKNTESFWNYVNNLMEPLSLHLGSIDKVKIISKEDDEEDIEFEITETSVLEELKQSFTFTYADFKQAAIFSTTKDEPMNLEKMKKYETTEIYIDDNIHLDLYGDYVLGAKMTIYNDKGNIETESLIIINQDFRDYIDDLIYKERNF